MFLFIDFGRAKSADHRNETDIVNMMLLFFTPIKDRNSKRKNWIFGSWLGALDIAKTLTLCRLESHLNNTHLASEVGFFRTKNNLLTTQNEQFNNEDANNPAGFP